MIRQESNIQASLDQAWQQYDRRIGTIDAALGNCAPDFLVISAPKTGTTWLRRNLVRHRGLYVPPIELKYFCTFWRWFDVNRLLEQFSEGRLRRKGDIGGSYVILPELAIRRIHSLFPELKFIFLMRNPIDRAWSHIRHDYRYRVSGFADYDGPLDTISLSQFVEEFWLDYYFAFGDYASTLNRWLSVFPAERFYVNFTVGIERDPRQVLVEIFKHLGVDSNVDLADFPASDCIFPGLDIGIPQTLETYLHRAYESPLGRLQTLLDDRFGLSLPKQWNDLRQEREQARNGISPPIPLPDTDDKYLISLLGRQLRCSHLPQLVESDYCGYNVMLYQGRFHALACCGGPMDLHTCSPDEIRRRRAEGMYLVHSSPQGIRRLIDRATA